MMRKYGRLSAAALPVLLGAALFACAARANTILVGPTCPLAFAIDAANRDSTPGGTTCVPGDGADTIVIPTTGVTVDMPQPAIIGDVAFVGAIGEPLAVPSPVNGDGQHRLFFVGNATHAPTVSFANLILHGGAAKGGNATQGAGAGGGLGGALFIHGGDVTLDHVSVSSNVASGGNASWKAVDGGSIYGAGGAGGGGMFGGGLYGATGVTGAGGGGCGLPVGYGDFGWGGGGGALAAGTYEVAGSGGAGCTPGPPEDIDGAFGQGGGGGSAGIAGGVSHSGAAGGFGSGGGGGAGQCAGIAGCGSMQGNGGSGGFGGGGGSGGGWPSGAAGAGGYGGFGGGGGANGIGADDAAVGTGGFGGGSAVENAGGGGGAGFGGAIFVRSGVLHLHAVAFDSNAASRGTSEYADAGIGKGGALFALATLTNANGNDRDMPEAPPTVTGCENTFTANSASDAGSSNLDNADIFGTDRLGLTLGCDDRVFAASLDSP